MGKSSTARLLVRALIQPSAQSRPSLLPPPRWAAQLAARHFSQTNSRRADPPDQTVSARNALSGFAPAGQASSQTKPSPAANRSGMDDLANLISNKASTLVENTLAAARNKINTSSLDDLNQMKREVEDPTGEYHFNVYSHKHNTHVTVSKPNRDVILSISCGNLGFRKSQRSSYDAAYQLGAYVCDRLYQRGWHKKIQRMEVTLRGFGPGREALTKILLGTEGRMLRQKITRVADGTRLKFGGCRSKKPRRLG